MTVLTKDKLADLVKRLSDTPERWAGRADELEALHKEAATVLTQLTAPLTQDKRAEDDLAATIAAKMAEPAFVELKVRLDANINWPRYLRVQKVGPTAVSDWIVRLPSGRELMISNEDWEAAVTALQSPPADMDGVVETMARAMSPEPADWDGLSAGYKNAIRIKARLALRAALPALQRGDDRLERLRAALAKIRKEDEQQAHPCDPPQYGYLGGIAHAALVADAAILADERGAT